MKKSICLVATPKQTDALKKAISEITPMKIAYRYITVKGKPMKVPYVTPKK